MANFFGKKQVVMGTLVVALGVAVYLNYYFADQSAKLPSVEVPTTQSTASDKELGEALNVNSGTVNTAETYFKQAKENRESSREEAMELVKEVINDIKATSEQKQEATIKLAQMAKAIEQETKIESLVKAKGFADCVVYIEEEKCSAVVQSSELTVQDAAKISQIITTQSGISAENINIVTVK